MKIIFRYIFNLGILMLIASCNSKHNEAELDENIGKYWTINKFTDTGIGYPNSSFNIKFKLIRDTNNYIIFTFYDIRRIDTMNLLTLWEKQQYLNANPALEYFHSYKDYFMIDWHFCNKCYKRNDYGAYVNICDSLYFSLKNGFAKIEKNTNEPFPSNDEILSFPYMTISKKQDQ